MTTSCDTVMTSDPESIQSDILFHSGGTLTPQDLASFRVSETDAWAVSVGEYQMYIPPPPAGGITLGFIMSVMKGCGCCTRSSLRALLLLPVSNILLIGMRLTDDSSELNIFFYIPGFGLNPASVTGEKKTLFYRRYVEALKFANGFKKYIRDPQFSSDGVSFTGCFSSASFWFILKSVQKHSD